LPVVRATATTDAAPSDRAKWTAPNPSAPAPSTRTRSPGETEPDSAMCRLVASGSTQAPCVGVSCGGITTLNDGWTRAYWAYPPMGKLASAQYCAVPARHWAHPVHPVKNIGASESPIRTPLTSRPSSTTVPQIS